MEPHAPGSAAARSKASGSHVSDASAVADKIRIFHLKYANAREMAGVVSQVFPTPVFLEGNVVRAGVRVVPDDRTNSLVVSADALGAELFPRIDELIQQLDVEVKPAH